MNTSSLKRLFVILVIISTLPGYCQWPSGIQEVEIPSSIDQETQKALVYQAAGNELRPLVVSLHTWSGNYQQQDTLAWLCADQNYNYIHPDFRGPNLRPEATGSPLVLSDIEDAISWSLENLPVDTSEIHVTGTSGGGYATLLSYMNSQFPVRTFTAWVPISNLAAWYYQSNARGNKYAEEVARSTSGSKTLDLAEARNRSPLFMPTPIERRKESKLYIYAGIHDGYTGSVPITHSVDMYNKLVSGYSVGLAHEIIPDEDLVTLLSHRSWPDAADRMLSDRKIHYQRQFSDKLQITLFEGSHERLDPVALDPLSARDILLIGDSNGAKENGWADQLAASHFRHFFTNTSVSGNTIGFDNLEKEKLNTLKMIDKYMSTANQQPFEMVVVMLGTNDCKAVFDGRSKEAALHLSKLIDRIRQSEHFDQRQGQIVVCAPPPVEADKIKLHKYAGMEERLDELVAQLEKVAKKQEVTFINIYQKMNPLMGDLTSDGIHFTEDGSEIIAKMISDELGL